MFACRSNCLLFLSVSANSSACYFTKINKTVSEIFNIFLTALDAIPLEQQHVLKFTGGFPKPEVCQNGRLQERAGGGEGVQSAEVLPQQVHIETNARSLIFFSSIVLKCLN